MQLTPAQRRFYIDPVQDPSIITEKILVTEERTTRGIHIDKVVAVEKKRVHLDYRPWWVTAEGDYVAGAPVNPPNLSRYDNGIIAPGGDGWFWYGQPTRRRDSGYACTDLRRSDGRQLPGSGNTGSYTLELTDVVRAASWASELFPAPGDTSSVIAAKLSLAEQRWTQRRAKLEIIRQGIARGWHDDLAELRENGQLPAATFGVTFKGRALIDSLGTVNPDLMTTRDSQRLDEIRERVRITDDNRPSMMIGLNVDVPLHLSFDTYEGARDVTADQLRESLRAATGDYTAVPGEYALTPVLRSLAA